MPVVCEPRSCSHKIGAPPPLLAASGEYTRNTHAVHHWECTWCRGDRTDTYLPITALLEGHPVSRPFNRSKPHPALTALF